MKQKDIWLADLEPVKGSEQGKTRPIVIISGDTMNDNFPVIIACPLSSVIKNFENCVVIKKNAKTGLSSDSEVITFQIRTISKTRLTKKLGEISEPDLDEIIEGLNDVLRF